MDRTAAIASLSSAWHFFFRNRQARVLVYSGSKTHVTCFPKMGLPPVIIHFNRIIHSKPSSDWGSPIPSITPGRKHRPHRSEAPHQSRRHLSSGPTIYVYGYIICIYIYMYIYIYVHINDGIIHNEY